MTIREAIRKALEETGLSAEDADIAEAIANRLNPAAQPYASMAIPPENERGIINLFKGMIQWSQEDPVGFHGARNAAIAEQAKLDAKN